MAIILNVSVSVECYAAIRPANMITLSSHNISTGMFMQTVGLVYIIIHNRAQSSYKQQDTHYRKSFNPVSSCCCLVTVSTLDYY